MVLLNGASQDKQQTILALQRKSALGLHITPYTLFLSYGRTFIITIYLSWCYLDWHHFLGLHITPHTLFLGYGRTFVIMIYLSWYYLDWHHFFYLVQFITVFPYTKKIELSLMQLDFFYYDEER